MITLRSDQSVMAPGSLYGGHFLDSNIKRGPVVPVVTTGNSTEKINKWITGNRRGVEDLVKKYNSTPTSDIKSPVKWKRSKVKAPAKPEPAVRAPEPEDERFIKSYTDYSTMMAEIEDLCRKHPTLMER